MEQVVDIVFSQNTDSHISLRPCTQKDYTPPAKSCKDENSITIRIKYMCKRMCADKIRTSKCPQHFTHAFMSLYGTIHVDNLVPETANHFAAAHTAMCNL